MIFVQVLGDRDVAKDGFGKVVEGLALHELGEIGADRAGCLARPMSRSGFQGVDHDRANFAGPEGREILERLITTPSSTRVTFQWNSRVKSRRKSTDLSKLEIERDRFDPNSS
jgi:hypothetical protein